jgi:nucleotide-binding universal stress UspA family protein
VIHLKHVLIATDFSPASDVALRYATELARTFSATLHVVHVVDELGAHTTSPNTAQLNLGQLQKALETEAREALDALVSDEDRKTLGTRTHLITAPNPAQAILAYAREHVVDVIVVGTQGRTGVAHLLLGSVAERIVRTAPCPVLTVRHPEHEFIRPDALETTVQQHAT